MSSIVAYWVKYHEKFLTALGEHLYIVLLTLVLSLALAAVLTILIRNHPRLSNALVQFFGAVYSIPSLALFALLIPISGLGLKTAVPVLVVYNQFLLLRNILEGLNGVDRSMLESARGMGMTDWQVLTKVQLPLAMPMVIAGLRLAAISTIGIGTIAATINAGGLGTILMEGLRTMNLAKLLGGTLLCTLIALVTNSLLKALENHLWKRQGRDQQEVS